MLKRTCWQPKLRQGFLPHTSHHAVGEMTGMGHTEFGVLASFLRLQKGMLQLPEGFVKPSQPR